MAPTKRHCYTAEFKLKAIGHAVEHGNRAAAREFNINKSMVRKWRKQEDALRQPGKRVTSDPSPSVQFRVGHKNKQSKTIYKTNDPVWEEHFTFLIHNPNDQKLEVEVKDEKHDCQLATLDLPLTRLLDAPEMTLNESFPLKSSGASCTLKMKMALRVLCIDDGTSSPTTSSPPPPQPVLNPSSASSTLRPTVSSETFKYPPSNNSPKLHSTSSPVQDMLNRHREYDETMRSPGWGDPTLGTRGEGPSLAEIGRSNSNLAIFGSQQYLAGGKEPTPSIASDISNPNCAQELRQRLQQMNNGISLSNCPLGEIRLTIRYSMQTSKLIVVIHSCRNLISFSDHYPDPYVRVYLLPDKRRSGRRKTSTVKKTVNPSYDHKCEFSVPFMELSRRMLDVAVKNGGSLFSKHRGLLGKVLVDLNPEEITKSWTHWFELSDDGLKKPHQH